jgi:tetratricopeptide (TPR) repeat protein
VFDVQEEISHSIAEALRVALTPTESRNLVQNRPNDAHAYDLYLKGREKYGRYNKEDMAQALRLFREATEIDPTYALAWAGMADSYAQMVQWGMTKEVEETLRLGLEAADRAISLNARLAEAHKAQGLVMRMMGNSEGERRALLKAIEVNPRFTPALINLAVEQYSGADVAGAERSFRRVMEIDPQEAFATTWLVAILLDTGRVEEATALVERVREIAPNPFYITVYYLLRSSVECYRNDIDAAEKTVSEALERGADRNNMKAVQAAIAGRRGRVQEVKALLQELMEQGGLGVGAIYALADAAIHIGEPDLALPFVNRSVAREIIGTMARITPTMHRLLDKPPLSPRRSENILVWPLEAPMPPASVRPLFRELHLESGIPKGSDIGVH